MTNLPTVQIQKTIDTGLERWVHLMCRRAITVVLLSVLVTIGLFYYSFSQIEINTDTSDMLSEDLPFRQNSIKLNQAFPQQVDNIVVVIDGPNVDTVSRAADLVVARLRQQPEIFGDVFDPAGLDFFRRNGLLYLDLEELEQLTDRLITAQPFLGTLWKNPTLPGLFNILSRVLKESKNNVELLSEARPIIKDITGILTAQVAGRTDRLSWRAIISNGSKDQPTRIILIKPKTDFGSLQPGAKAIKQLREIGVELDLAKEYGTRLRLTGSVALAEEELKSVVDGLGFAGLLSLTLVLALLFWALRSLPLVLATLFTLVSGLIWTAGFATWVVGTLNLISVAFAVLFIGLSVDFGIHFTLRYLEASNRKTTALPQAAKQIGGALILSALAAAIGFFSFLPTDYIGLAELGVIAGGGMFIALFANLTLLPALISLMPNYQTKLSLVRAEITPKGFYRPIIFFAIIFGIISVLLARNVQFDFDPLNLKDTETESVSTFIDLMAEGHGNIYAITVLAKDLDAANSIAEQVKKLPEVDGAVTLSSLVPTKQAEKLMVIENLALILEPALSGSIKNKGSTPAKRLGATINLQKEIKSFLQTSTGSKQLVEVNNLDAALTNLLTTRNPELGLAELEQRLLTNLPRELHHLKESLKAAGVTLQNIPVEMKIRQITDSGNAKVEINPKGNMQNREELATFVGAIRAIAPSATGTPVIILEAGNAVIHAFIEAAGITFVLIFLLVLFLTRSIREITLIISPLILAAIYTLAASVLLDLPFNFANVIVLPLLFGLGIAGSIHLVMRDRDSSDNNQDVMATSTPRAITFSALTTIASFGSIALSSHPGTSSMGVLLTIAIIISLICTLVVLPALLKAWPKAGSK